MTPGGGGGLWTRRLIRDRSSGPYDPRGGCAPTPPGGQRPPLRKGAPSRRAPRMWGSRADKDIGPCEGRGRGRVWDPPLRKGAPGAPLLTSPGGHMGPPLQSARMRGRMISTPAFGAACVARDDLGTRKIWPEWRAGSWPRPASSRPKSRRCAAVGLEMHLRVRSRPVGPIHLLAPHGWDRQAGASKPPFQGGCRRRQAVTGGFLSPARAIEKDGGRNPPSRLRRATSLFKGGFWGAADRWGHRPLRNRGLRADDIRPYEGTEVSGRSGKRPYK